MGRTATAFLVLVAVGGCVADNQGPAAFQSAQKGQSPAVCSCYASWSKPDQFAVLHDDTMVPHPTPASTATPTPTAQRVTNTAVAALPAPAATPTPTAQRVTNTAVAALPAPAAPPAPAMLPAALRASSTPTLKPLPPLPPGEVLPPSGGSPAAQAAAASDVVIDPELARATMVQTPADRPEADLLPTKIQPTSFQAKKPAPDGEAPAGPAAPPAYRMVNNKRVTINYELKDMGASGVSGVEVWCTQDAHKWKRAEIVAQTNHSFSVVVKEEGWHGFTLLPRNGLAGGKEMPAVDEEPQVWVMVDWTKPVVQINSVEVAPNGNSPSVHIHWTAKDKNLGRRPITLSYAEQSEGPWTVIGSALENTGLCEWQPPSIAPHNVYLRVQAADMAGNVATVQTANALRLDEAPTAPAPSGDGIHKPVPTSPSLDTSRPSAAILGVETNGN